MKLYAICVLAVEQEIWVIAANTLLWAELCVDEAHAIGKGHTAAKRKFPKLEFKVNVWEIPDNMIKKAFYAQEK